MSYLIFLGLYSHFILTELAPINSVSDITWYEWFTMAYVVCLTIEEMIQVLKHTTFSYLYSSLSGTLDLSIGLLSFLEVVWSEVFWSPMENRLAGVGTRVEADVVSVRTFHLRPPSLQVLVVALRPLEQHRRHHVIVVLCVCHPEVLIDTHRFWIGADVL